MTWLKPFDLVGDLLGVYFANRPKPRRPLETDDDLRGWVRDLLGQDFAFPETPCCPDHQSPFDFLYSLVFKRNRQTGAPERKILGVGARGTYKTLGFAVSEAIGLAMGENIAHIGAIQAQALRCWSYVSRMLARPALSESIVGRASRRGVHTSSGGSLEILWATRNQLNSPHVPTIRFDEIELADPEIAAEALGILSDSPGVTPSIAEISSLKFASGVVQQKIDSAHDDDRAVYVWCYKEAAEPCPDERSGTDPATAYVDADALSAYTPEEWAKLPAEERETHLPVEVFDRCHACKLLATCRGDLKRASGTQSLERLEVQFTAASPSFWVMQMESRQAQIEGAVFSSFRNTGLRSHVRPQAEFGTLEIKRGPVYVGLDPGRHHPSLGLYQHVLRPSPELAKYLHPGGVVLWDEEHDYQQDMDCKIEDLETRLVAMLARHGLEKRHVTIACDPAGDQEGMVGEAVVEWLEKRGWIVETPQAYISEGIDLILGRLKWVAGRTNLLLATPKQGAHSKSFRNYRNEYDKVAGVYLDKPKKDNINDHCCDEARYAISVIDMPRAKSGVLQRG